MFNTRALCAAVFSFIESILIKSSSSSPNYARRFCANGVLTRAASLLLLVSILSNSTFAAAPGTGTTVFLSFSEFGQDIRYTYLAHFKVPQLPDFSALSGSLASLNFLGSPTLALVFGKNRLRGRKQERAAVAKIEVTPNRAVLREGEQIAFAAVAYDARNNPVQGVAFKWSVADAQGKSPRLNLLNGVFKPQFAGQFEVTAETGAIKQTITVRVLGDTRLRVAQETDARMREAGNEKQKTKQKNLPPALAKILSEQNLPAPVKNSTRMNAEELRELNRWDSEIKKQKPAKTQRDPQRQLPPIKKAEPIGKAQGNGASAQTEGAQTSQTETAVQSDGEQYLSPGDGAEAKNPQSASETTSVYSNSAKANSAVLVNGQIDSFNTSSMTLTGCAYDYQFSYPNVEIYIDGDVYSGTFLGTAYPGYTYNPSCYPNNSGFDFTVPSYYADGQQHQIHAYVWDNSSSSYYELFNSPLSFTAGSSGGGGTPTGDPNWNNGNFPTADEPGQQPGNPADTGTDGAGSSNFSFTAPAVALGGRGDLGVNLALSYNSLLWHKSGSEIVYDIDKGFPGPGWNIGFGKMMDMGSAGGAMLETPDGTRHSYEGTIQSYYYGYSTYYGRTTDGSFIDYTAWRAPSGLYGGQANIPNGTTITYGAAANGVMYPTQIEDRHGNYQTISYVSNQGPRIQTITDNLGRNVSFNYDGANRLVSITGPGQNGGTRVFVRIHYRQLALSYGFAGGLTPLVRDANPYVVDAIYYPDTGTGYWFGDNDSYSSYGMIAKVKEMRGMTWAGSGYNDQGTITAGLMSREMTYDYPLAANNSLIAAPQYTQMTEDWANRDIPAPVTTTYNNNSSATPRTTTITLPNQNKIKQYSINNPNGWNDGLLEKVETLSPTNQVLSKSETTWEQGDYNSPRVTQVLTTDEKNQMTKQAFDYSNSIYNEVASARDYGYSNNLLRTKAMTYEMGANYRGSYANINGSTVWSSGRHIFSLPKTEEIFDAGNVRLSRQEYFYDGATLVDTPNVVMYNQTKNPHVGETVQGPNCVRWEYDPYGPNYDPWNNPEGGYWYCAEYEQIQYFNPEFLARGNVTQTKSYADAVSLSGAVIYDSTYDVTGNARTTTTNCCQQMSFNYTTNTQYSQPDSHTKGSSDPNSPDRMTEYAGYDFNTGHLNSSIDFNGRTTQYFYDAADRRNATVAPTGAKVVIHYITNDQYPYIAEQALDAANVTQSYSHTYYNGRGQTRYVMNHVPNTANFWDVQNFNNQEIKYDQMGRKSQESIVFNNQSGNPNLWTTYSYDQLSRVTQVTAPDGSVSQTAYNELTAPQGASSNVGNTVRSKDAWGRERWARTDDFGRLTEVVEPDPNGTGALAAGGNLQTSYAYDAMDQLITIYQGAQQRWFAYDSLGRLTRQKLAEQNASLNAAGQFVGAGQGQWSDAFFYDNRSNLIQRVDARGVKTNFNYTVGSNPDPLNRLQGVSYDKSGADTSKPIQDASPVNLSYMNAGDKTRVSQAQTWWTNETNTYDVEGRISDYTITLPSSQTQPLTTSYLYDSLSRLTEIRYPAAYGMAGNPRKTVTPTYDESSRLKELKVDNQIQMSEIAYNPMSQVTSLKTGAATGNADLETYDYVQATGLLLNQRVVKAANQSQVLLDQTYEYERSYSAGSASNGTLSGKTGQLTHIVNNLDRNKDRNYEYDALGRLKTAKGGGATGTQGVTANWTQNYAYDRYGNRTNVTAAGVAQNSQAVPTDGIANQSYDQESNRITTAGHEYDLAGNLTRGQNQSGVWERYDYDAANRLVQVRDDNGNEKQGNGYTSSRQRLVRNEPNVGLTWYVWGGSSVISEYTSGGWGNTPLSWTKSYVYAGSRLLSTFTNNGSGGETLEFHHPDRLGTKLVTNNTANSSFEQSTLPFGTNLSAETTGTTNQRFTTYDRSTVVSTDYAVNRHYSSGQGRFTSVDPIGMSAASIGNPQSLNLYVYVENNPIDFTDPSGLFRAREPERQPEFDWESWWRFLMDSWEFSRGAMSGGGSVDGGRVGVVEIRAEPDPVTTEDPCDIHRHNLRRPAIRNALNNAWNRSQYSKNKKLRERNAREQGGLLSSTSKNGKVVKRTNHEYKRDVSERRTALAAITVWAAAEMAVPSAGQTFDYAYHTHPFEEGDYIPGEVVVGNPHIPSTFDWGTTEYLKLDSIIVTSKYFIVADVSSGIICTINR